jgi:hypothetical protein
MPTSSSKATLARALRKEGPFGDARRVSRVAANCDSFFNRVIFRSMSGNTGLSQGYSANRRRISSARVR